MADVRRAVRAGAALLASSVLLAAGGVGAAPASASVPWPATALPAVTPGPTGSFETSPAVSCAAAGVCVAVGSYAPVGEPSPSLGGGTVPLAEMLSAGTWTAAALPVPPGGSQVSLSAVSCPSATSCVAVGQYSPPGGGVAPLVEILAGGAWSATAPALPPGAYFTSLSPVPLLGAVACTSSAACVAVGVYPVHQGRTLGCCYRYFPLVETLAGSSWTASTAPVPAGGTDASLSGVSCSQAADCVAVGNDDADGGPAPLVENLSGTRWRAAPLPLPAGASYPGPYPWTVSCGGVGACVALGADVPGSSAGGLVVDTLSGAGWVTEPLTLPTGSGYPFPFTYGPEGGISCRAVVSCVAVVADETGGVPGAVAETLAGTAWSSATLSAPPDGSLPLPQALSCATTAWCAGVGTYRTATGADGALSEVLSGSTWLAGAPPLPTAVPWASLTAVSCPSAGRCVAVGGDYGADDVQAPLAESLSGSTWTAMAIRLPSPLSHSANATPLLQAVSCPSAVSCVAVGYDPGPALAEHPLAEVLSGGTWRPERLPLPARFRHQSALLSGISCLSATACVAVGSLTSEDAALVETLTPTGWTATAVAPPAGAPRAWLSAVSCPAAGSCMAVGAYWGPSPGYSRPMAATLSGTTWTTAALSLPRNARDDVAFTVPLLRAVSCTSITSCTAAGFYPTGFDVTAPVVENLSGTSWRPRALADSAHWTLLWGLSCVSATSCVAVGEADGRAGVEALSDGAWTPVPVVTPAPETATALLGVDCDSPTACVAVGGGAGPGGTFALVADGST